MKPEQKNYPQQERPKMKYPLDPDDRLVVKLNVHIDNIEHENKLKDEQINELSNDILKFAEWCSLNEWIKSHNEDFWFDDLDKRDEKTTIELYQDYKNIQE